MFYRALSKGREVNQSSMVEAKQGVSVFYGHRDHLKPKASELVPGSLLPNWN